MNSIKVIYKPQFFPTIVAKAGCSNSKITTNTIRITIVAKHSKIF
jgi:hypothetical protein